MATIFRLRASVEVDVIPEMVRLCERPVWAEPQEPDEPANPTAAAVASGRAWADETSECIELHHAWCGSVLAATALAERLGVPFTAQGRIDLAVIINDAAASRWAELQQAGERVPDSDEDATCGSRCQCRRCDPDCYFDMVHDLLDAGAM